MKEIITNKRMQSSGGLQNSFPKLIAFIYINDNQKIECERKKNSKR